LGKTERLTTLEVEQGGNIWKESVPIA